MSEHESSLKRIKDKCATGEPLTEGQARWLVQQLQEANDQEIRLQEIVLSQYERSEKAEARAAELNTANHRLLDELVRYRNMSPSWLEANERAAELERQLSSALSDVGVLTAQLAECQEERDAATVLAVELRTALEECAAWLESRPEYTEGDAATASSARAALALTPPEALAKQQEQERSKAESGGATAGEWREAHWQLNDELGTRIAQLEEELEATRRVAGALTCDQEGCEERIPVTLSESFTEALARSALGGAERAVVEAASAYLQAQVKERSLQGKYGSAWQDNEQIAAEMTAAYIAEVSARDQLRQKLDMLVRLRRTERGGEAQP